MERSDLTWTPGGERSQARVEGRYNQCKGVITGEGSDRRRWKGVILGERE